MRWALRRLYGFSRLLDRVFGRLTFGFVFLETARMPTVCEPNSVVPGVVHYVLYINLTVTSRQHRESRIQRQIFKLMVKPLRRVV